MQMENIYRTVVGGNGEVPLPIIPTEAKSFSIGSDGIVSFVDDDGRTSRQQDK